jgi:hypothetical protein
MHVQCFSGQYLVRGKRISVRRQQRRDILATCIILRTQYAFTTSINFTSSILEDEGSTFSLTVDVKVQYRKV